MDKMTPDNLYRNNNSDIAEIRERVQLEIAAAKNQSFSMGAVLEDLQVIINTILGQAIIRIRGAGGDALPLTSIVSQYVKSITTILSGGIISPLMGVESEWEELPIPENAPKEITVPFRGENIVIPYKSIQVNRRYPQVYRFNKDNNYAHAMDYIRIHDKHDMSKYVTTAVSRRFIKFPYTLEHVDLVVDRVNVTPGKVNIPDYGGGNTENDLYNMIIFKDNDNYLVAPPIPFHMLKKYGCDYNEELLNAATEDGNIPNLGNS